MNISFAPANYRPNFQARFNNDAWSRIILRELAEKDPEKVLAANLLLEDMPDDAVYKLDSKLTPLGTPRYSLHSSRKGWLLFPLEPECYQDIFRALSCHYEKQCDAPWYSSNNKYMLQAKEAVAEYRKNLSPESYELAEEIDDLVKLRDEIDDKIRIKTDEKALIDKKDGDKVAKAIVNGIFEV